MKTFLHKSFLTLGLILSLVLNSRATAETARPEFSGPTAIVAPVRPATPEFSGPTHRLRPAPVEAGAEITLEKAEEVFRAMASQKDIAFQYAWDGCFARSHLMIRRMQALGLRPQQAFIRANGAPLTVETAHGVVRWRYHVAPVLRVNVYGRSEWMVIDPSLFSSVVTLKEWVSRQRGASDAEPRVDLVPVGGRSFADGSPVPGGNLSDTLARRVMDYLLTLDPRYPPPADWYERATRPGVGGLSRLDVDQEARRGLFAAPLFSLAA
jgi:hypothetical protein